MDQVYAAGSEDMDTLTFNSPILLRHLTFSEARKMPISEIRLDRALEGLEMSMDQVSSIGIRNCGGRGVECRTDPRSFLMAVH